MTVFFARELSMERSLMFVLLEKHSASIYQKREHVVIGVSPFNSFFSEENLISLFRWGLGRV